MKGSIMKKYLLVLAAAAGVSAISLQTFAQMPGAHGGTADPTAVIAALKDKLSLNTSQQLQFDNVLAQTQAARQAGRAGHEQLKAGAQAELAKAEPDLASLARQADAIHEQDAASRKTVRDAWLALYATFTPQQKAVVRDALSARMARMEQFRAHMLDRLGH
jgi:hypothetical protein